jgi:hypothetical protein
MKNNTSIDINAQHNRLKAHFNILKITNSLKSETKFAKFSFK